MDDAATTTTNTTTTITITTGTTTADTVPRREEEREGGCCERSLVAARVRLAGLGLRVCIAFEGVGVCVELVFTAWFLCSTASCRQRRKVPFNRRECGWLECGWRERR